jgi:hypothetical protein
MDGTVVDREVSKDDIGVRRDESNSDNDNQARLAEVREGESSARKGQGGTHHGCTAVYVRTVERGHGRRQQAHPAEANEA